LDAFIDHIDYVVQLVGIDHVALGIDYFEGMHPLMSLEKATRQYDDFIASGIWSAASYPPPPYHYPEGIETPEKFANLTVGLLRRGYGEADIRKILGGNWLRVYEAVWGA
jgi:membrane dipeptidase